MVIVAIVEHTRPRRLPGLTASGPASPEDAPWPCSGRDVSRGPSFRLSQF